MKKLLTILMLLTASLPLWAYDLEVDGIYYNKIVSTSTVQVTNYDSQANSNSYSGTVVIPETVSVNGVTYKVTSIGAYAFVDCENLTAIEIPGTVTEIGTNAFLHCYGLSSVTIADGETTLELANYQAGNWPRGLFFDCPIETLYLGRDLSYDINTQEGITRTPFSQITELTTLTIGNNVTKIGVDAFVDCSGLTSVIIPNNITSIGGGAFEGCTGLTEFIIPESVQEILGNTFKNCTGLTEITIPNSVTSIGNYAFEGCTKLSTITCNATTPPAVEENSFPSYDVTLDIPTESLSLYLEHPVWSKFKFAITTLPLYYKVIDANNKYVEVINDASYASYNGPVVIPSTTVIDGVTYTVTSIGYYAFRNCTGLTLVAIPESVTSIGGQAFDGCTGLTSITIPNSVTSIGANAFDGCTGLTSITIGNGVTSIGYSAFKGCTGLREVIMDDGETTLSLGMNGSKGIFADCPLETLYYGRTLSYNSYNTAILPFGSKTTLTSVIIGNSVTSIGNGAFYGCTGLTSITIPDGVTSIGSNAFYGCTGLTSITIPNSVTSIGESAFQNCTGLTEITLGNGVTSIGGSAFTNCSISNIYFNDIAAICKGVWSALPRASSVNYYYKNELLTELVIPEGVTMIGNNAFQYCTSLTEVTIPESVTSIGSNAFEYCTGLTEVTIGNGVTSIGSYAFRNCTGLTSITIPDSVTSIGGYAFLNCTGLTEVTIGNGVTSIEICAFANCRGLVSITLGNGVTSIGTNALSSCSISNIYFDDLTTICSGVWDALSRASSVNYYYKNELLTELVIPDSITSIGNGAFKNCTSLTSITIPNSVTSVGNFVFNGCTALKEVRFIDGNSTITLGCNIIGERGNLGRGLFYDCPLETLYLGRTLSYIGDTGGGYSPIYNKKTLTSVTIGDSVTSIGNFAFQYCTGLTSITIPNSVTSIGSRAFDRCTGLTSVTIPESVTSIGGYAFSGCTGLTEVTIGNGVTSIGYYAFENCTGLTKITLGNGVTSIGNSAFYNCKFSDIYVSDIATICKDIWSALPRASSVNYYYNNELLTELVIPDSITSIGNNAFQNSKSLTSVTIPNSVTSIGAYALYGCTGLTSITIPNSVTSIGAYALYGCTGLTSITIPNSVTSIGGYAFCGCTGLTEITIPNSVTSIEGSVFWNCTGLTSITIPESVTSIGGSAFGGCTGLTEITIPNSVTSIGSYAFKGCTGLKEVIMEDGEAVLNLGNNNSKGLFNDCPIHTLYLGRTLSYDASSSGGYSPFYNQIYLKNLTIGNIRILSENLFNGCSNLVGNLTLSSSIDSIASNAFASTQYTLCRIQAKEPPVVVDAAALGNITFVRVPQGSRTAYKTADVWKDLTIVEEDPEYEVEITVTESGKLSQDIVMEYMIVPQSVTKLTVHGTINVEDFKQMRTNMTSCYSIDLSDADCVALPDSAFEGKYYLTELILPNNCTSIGKAAFVNCTGLDSIVIPDNVSIIGERAFMNCKGLKFMGAGRYLSIIGEYAFQNCILLDNVTLPTGLKTIERYAFENCSTLTSIVIPNGVTSLGAGAFKNCISLVSASIPGTVEVVESYTFDNCQSLKELTLGEGVKTLSENAVRSGNFETFIIPSSLTNLGATSLSSTKIKKLIISDSENELYLPNSDDWTTGRLGAFPKTGITYLYIGRDWRYQNAAIGSFPTTITSVEIGPQVTTLKKIADCPNLKTLSVSSLNHLLSLTIESHPFAASGSGVLYIDGEAITNVVIPDNITAIKDYTFLNCTNIEAVTLPDSITTIGNQAFKGCTSLTTVNLSDTLQSIGNEAFYGCSALANITCPALVPPTVGTDGFEGVDNYTCILTIPGDSLINYMLAEHWGAFIQKRKRIDVDVETPVVDEGVGEGESGSEGDGNTGTGTGNHCGGHIWYDRDWHKHHGGHHAPRRYAAAEEETAVSGIDATIGDGLSLFIATDSVVTFLIEPEEGYNIGSVRYGGVDVTDQLNNGVFTTSAVSANTKLEVSFVEGEAPEAPVVAGDANDDATVNISDVVVIVNYILGDESGVTSVDNADVNEDGVINIGDVPGVVNIILSASVQAAPIRYEGAEGVLSMNDVIIAQGETTGIEVSLDNAVPYTAFQMDVTLPEGLTANDITLSNRISLTHSLMWRMQEDNTLRVVVFAPDNSTIADNRGALFTIDVTAGSAFEGGHIVADNTIFTARDLTMHYLDGAEAAAINPAGVDGIYTADRIYTIGRTLVIESTCNQAAYITTTGGVMRAVELQAGRNEIAMLHQGLYIVVVGSETQKVIIR